MVQLMICLLLSFFILSFFFFFDIEMSPLKLYTVDIQKNKSQLNLTFDYIELNN